MATVTTTSNPAAVNEYFDRKLLYRAKQAIVYEKVAEQRPLKGNQGKILVMRRYPALPLATTPLSEGVPPGGRSVDFDDIQATILPYGDFIEHTDEHEYTIDHPVLNEYSDLLGQQAGETMDSLLAAEAVAAFNVLFGGNAANRAALDTTADKITGADLDRAIRFLSSNNALRYTSRVNPSQNISTAGILPAFWGIVHPEIYFSLREIAGWTEVTEYASSGAIMPNEVGAYRDIRFMLSTLAPVIRGGGGASSSDIMITGGAADVFQTVICARHALGVVPLAGNNMRMITKKLGSAGAADPLDQVATQGWKHFGARKILNDDFLVLIESVAGNAAP